jgi:hypothetical protein
LGGAVYDVKEVRDEVVKFEAGFVVGEHVGDEADVARGDSSGFHVVD